LALILGVSNAFAPQTTARLPSLWGVAYGETRLYAVVEEEGDALKIIIAGARKDLLPVGAQCVLECIHSPLASLSLCLC